MFVIRYNCTSGEALAGLQDDVFGLAEGETHVLLSDVRVAFVVEWRAGNADYLVLVSQLVSESIVLTPGVALLILEILFLHFHLANICHDEVASLRHPEV